MNKLIYERFDALELIGEYEGFNWSIENFGTSYEVKYLLIKLHLTDEFKIPMIPNIIVNK